MKPIQPALSAICAFSLILGSLALLAQKAGHREQCRQAMVAQYNDLYHSITVMRDLKTLTEEGLKKHAANIKKISKDYISFKKTYENEEFSAENEEKLSALEYLYEFDREHLAELGKIQKELESNLPVRNKQIAELQRLSEGLFTVKMMSEPVIYGKDKPIIFPGEIDFTESCPKYRFTCPLSNTAANKLRSLMAARPEFREDCLP